MVKSLDEKKNVYKKKNNAINNDHRLYFSQEKIDFGLIKAVFIVITKGININSGIV